jgi:hypothetical protein
LRLKRVAGKEKVFKDFFFIINFYLMFHFLMI